MDRTPSKEQELISRLMSKVSEQALELGELSSQLDYSRHILAEESSNAHARSPDSDRVAPISDSLRTALNNSTSGAAVQKRLEKDHNLQMLAVQRQLETAESKLADHIKAKKKLLQDLETKTREATFYVKKCQDLQLENQQLRHQVEQTLKMTSITANAKGAKLALKSVDSITHFKTCDELKHCQGQNEQLKRDLVSAADRESQYRMRVKVLEEALEFRSEEIGLSGHSDLLAKVAKLRGEVTALKSELTNKHQRIAEVEDTKADLTGRHETLQRHVAQLQQRLSQSQQEMYRLQNGDVGELLRQAEAERDKLLQFIQSDMQKSSALGKHVEQLEAELRGVRKHEATVGESAARLQGLLDAEAQKYKQLEERFGAALAQLKEVQHQNQILEAEKVALANQFNRKNTEADEVNRMQMNLFVQNQAKDEEIKKRSEEVQSLRSQLRELQSSAPGMESENARLRERLKFVQDEVAILRDSVNVMEPKLARIEPELNTLRNERETWHSERLQADSELSRLRPVGRLLADLTNELVQLNELAAKAGSGSSLDVNSSATLSPSKSLFDQGVSLSQRHSLWVGLPSLRSLNSTLYENIRRLAHDLHSKELHCSELISRLHHVTTEMDSTARNNEAQWQQLTKQQETSTQTIQRLSDLVNSTEREIAVLRSNRITVDQIRSVLASYPGSFLQQKLHEILAGERGSGAVHMSHREEAHLESKQGEQFTPLHKPVHHTSSAHSGSPTSSYDSVDALLNKIPDHALPDLIGRAIMHNANAVIELQTVKDKLQRVEDEHATLSAEFAALSRMQIDYDNLVHEQQEKLVSADARLQSLQRECFEKVDGATELAEKQNALTMTLEAKIEKLHRERQLRSAQLTALQQREESFRARLVSALQEYCARVKLTPPPDGCKLVDLLHYNAEILRSRTGTVLDGGIHFSSAASSSMRVASPNPRKSAGSGQSSTDSAGKVKKSGASKGKRSPSTSPEQDATARVKGDIRARLSPAAQRFVAESSEYASTTSIMRRLPSPVLNRSRYDSSFSTLRSPSADATMQRSFAVNSMEDLTTSRISGRSLTRPHHGVSETSHVHSARGASPLLHVHRSHPAVTASTGGRSAAATGPVSSTSSVLQERLREAQKAFAAMRESHQY